MLCTITKPAGKGPFLPSTKSSDKELRNQILNQILTPEATQKQVLPWSNLLRQHLHLIKANWELTGALLDAELKWPESKKQYMTLFAQKFHKLDK